MQRQCLSDGAAYKAIQDFQVPKEMMTALKLLYGKLLSAFLYPYYWIKVQVLKPFVGEEALAYVLHDSLFPMKVLKLGGAKIGNNVRVGRWMTVHESRGHFRNLRIDDDAWVGKYVLIDLSDKVHMGKRTGLGMRAIVITHDSFGLSELGKTSPRVTAPVEIMDDAIVSWGCILNKGTKVLPRAVVMSGTVVSGTLNEGATYGGNPARMVPIQK